MKNKINRFWFLSALIIYALFSCSLKGDYRHAANAGSFYPSDKIELRKMLDYFFSHVTVNTDVKPDAIIVPHAGYEYSGGTAAYAYNTLKGKNIKRVILLATSHYAYVNGIVINEKAYETPLGVYNMDRQAIDILKREDFDHVKNEIESTREHSDEVQIPFLQEVLPDAKLVPLIVGELFEDEYTNAAKALNKIIDDKTVIVVSSDFTHYGERFEYTPDFGGKSIKDGVTELDGKAIGLITNRDYRGFVEYIKKVSATICGAHPIALLLRILEERNYPFKGNLLKYTMSGELTGDYSNNVSYSAILFGDVRSIQDIKSDKPSIDRKLIGDDDEKTLLKLSRNVLETFVKKNSSDFPPDKLKDYNITENLSQKLGVFVTLTKKGDLRGCIGYITGRDELYRAVIANTINAAANDPRFPPVAGDELKNISIEISVMTPMVRINSPEEIRIGRDGLYLENNGNAGVFLPQVPLEQNWDRKTYLEELGMKAGLTADAYKDRNTVLYRFSAQVFGEK